MSFTVLSNQKKAAHLYNSSEFLQFPLLSLIFYILFNISSSNWTLLWAPLVKRPPLLTLILAKNAPAGQRGLNLLTNGRHGPLAFAVCELGGGGEVGGGGGGVARTVDSSDSSKFLLYIQDLLDRRETRRREWVWISGDLKRYCDEKIKASKYSQLMDCKFLVWPGLIFNLFYHCYQA